MATRSHPRSVFGRRRRSPLCLALGLLLVLVIAVVAAAAAGCGDEKPAKVAATVDGVEILDADVRSAMAAAALAGTDLSYARARSQLVDEALMTAEAERLGVTVADDDVAARLAEVADESGGRKALEAIVEKAGLTLDDYTARVRGALLAERLAAVKFERVRASSREARAYLAENPDEFVRPAEFDLGDIVVKTERQAEAVRGRIADGQSFASAARQFSTDPAGKADGGRMGWVLADSVPGEMRDALTGIEVGELTEPLQALGSWHVLKLYGRRDEKRFTFAEVGDDLVAELTRRRRVKALQGWLGGARERAEIVIAG